MGMNVVAVAMMMVLIIHIVNIFDLQYIQLNIAQYNNCPKRDSVQLK